MRSSERWRATVTTRLSRSPLGSRQNVGNDNALRRVGQLWAKPVAVGLTVLILAFGSLIAVAQFRAFARWDLVGIDYRTMMQFGRDWLERGTMYREWQFAPYPFDAGAGGNDLQAIPALYPPTAGPVFAVWSYLPAVLWWAIPIGVVAYVIWRLRPAPWSWPVMAAVLLLPATASIIVVGGTTMWITAGIAGGILWGWPALVILLKPPFLPFMVVGFWHRSFWVGLAVVTVAGLLMPSEWWRYLAVIDNADSPGLLYSIRDFPTILVPIIAWLASTDVKHGIAALHRGQVQRARGDAGVGDVVDPALDEDGSTEGSVLVEARS